MRENVDTDSPYRPQSNRASGPQARAVCSLPDLLRPESVVLRLEATDKAAVLQELSGLLMADQPRQVQEAVLEALIHREEEASTGIGDGVAIPHARTPAIQEMRMAVGVSQEGLDFESLDGKPVYLFFLILTPASAAGLHLKLLSQLTKLLRSSELRDALRSATDADEFCRILRVACKQAQEPGS